MIGAIVLAAGESTRMGRQKALLPWRGATIIENILNALEAGGVGETVVVVGYNGDAICKQITGCAVRITENINYNEGMLSSVRCGLQALGDEVTTVLVALGDNPSISGKVVTKMAEKLGNSSKTIATPVFKGRRGHPLLFSTVYREEILSCYDDTGLRGLIRSHPDEVLEITVDEPGILEDLDTPADYAKAIERER